MPKRMRDKNKTPDATSPKLLKQSPLKESTNIAKESSIQAFKAIEQAFFLKCPSEFLFFYHFCLSIDQKDPLGVFYDTLKLRLVGPFEILNGVSAPTEAGGSSQWYRYFHDPPELVTVAVGIEGYHIGYFRDKPSDEPTLVVESKASKQGKLDILGHSLPVAFSNLLRRKASSDCPLLYKLGEFCNRHDISDKSVKDLNTSRRKQIVCSTLNGLGVSVNVKKDDVGYRPLSVTYAKLTGLLQAVVTAKSTQAEMLKLEAIDELVTFAQFACDEGDFGQSLDLGLSLLAFHPTDAPIERASLLNRRIRHLLSVGYQLAGRPQFAAVASQHMSDRRVEPKTSAEPPAPAPH